MKNARQKEIMDIIRQYTVSNQDALQELLKKAEKAEEVDTPVPYSHFDVAGKYVKS